MQDLMHNNIVIYLDSSVNPAFVVMRYYPKGNLSKKILRDFRIEEKEALKLAKGILSAIKFCHKKEVYSQRS